MKVTYPLCPGRVVEVEGATLADAFRDLARTVEVFGETHCGLCGGDAITPVAREAGGFEFFEWRCLDPKCAATLTMGVRKDKDTPGRLFPVRNLDRAGKPDWKDGTPGAHRGWTLYRGPGTEAGNGGPRTPAPTPRAPAASAEPPAPPRPAPPPPTPTASGTLTVGEREAIANALRVSGIGRQTFLRWCGYTDAALIPCAEYQKLLAAAKRPPADLVAMMAR